MPKIEGFAIYQTHRYKVSVTYSIHRFLSMCLQHSYSEFRFFCFIIFSFTTMDLENNLYFRC